MSFKFRLFNHLGGTNMMYPGFVVVDILCYYLVGGLVLSRMRFNWFFIS